MLTLRLGWAITGRMIAYGVIGGAGFGLLWGPTSILLLFLIDRVGRVLDIVSDITPGSLSMLVPWLVGASLGGIGLGTLTGLIGGMVIGPVLTAFHYLSNRFVVSSVILHFVSCAVSGVTGGLVSLFVTTDANLAARYVSQASPIGWILWVAIPVAISFTLFWWAAGRIATYLLSQVNGQP